MVQKINNKFNLKVGRRQRLMVSGIFVFLVVFAMSYVVGSEILATDMVKAASSQVEAVVNDTNYYVSVTASPSVSFNVGATAAGGLGVGGDAVHVRYNVARYQLYLSMNDDTTTLKKNGDTSKIIPMTTQASYKKLGNNTWGFNVGAESTSSNPPASTEEEDGEEAFKAIPTAGIKIGEGSGAQSVENNAYYNVRYGVKATTSIPAGLYQGTVKYSVIGDLGASGTAVAPSVVEKGTPTTIKLSTNIMTNMAYGTWTMTVGGTDCTNVQTDTVNGLLVVSCTVPTLSKGSYNVIASSTKYGTFTAQNQLIITETYTYTLSYNLNGGSGGPSTQTGTAVEPKALIIPKIEPTKTEQVFLGWADTQAEANALTVKHRLYDGSGTNEIVLSASTPTVTLYAVWADNMTNSNVLNRCSLGTESTTSSVRNYVMADPRDKKLYVTRRLKDGYCWMIQNLDLDIAMSGSTMGTINTVTNEFVKFTDSNTNLKSGTAEWTIISPNVGYATQISTGETWDAYGRNRNATAGETQNNSYEVRSYDIDKGEPSKACYTNGTTATSCTTAAGAADVTRAGNYYNWPAATAGTGTYSVSSGDVTGSICPANWQLPYGGNGTGTYGGNTEKGFYYLLNDVAATSSPKDAPLLANPYSYIRAGYYYHTGDMLNQGSYGYYFSRTASSSSNAYRLYLNSSYLELGTNPNNNNKGVGYSVRCVTQAKITTGPGTSAIW